MIGIGPLEPSAEVAPPLPPSLLWEQLEPEGCPFVLRVRLTEHQEGRAYLLRWTTEGDDSAWLGNGPVFPAEGEDGGWSFVLLPPSETHGFSNATLEIRFVDKSGAFSRASTVNFLEPVGALVDHVAPNATRLCFAPEHGWGTCNGT